MANASSDSGASGQPDPWDPSRSPATPPPNSEPDPTLISELYPPPPSNEDWGTIDLSTWTPQPGPEAPPGLDQSPPPVSPAGAPGPTRQPGIAAPGQPSNSTHPASTIFDAFSGPEQDAARAIVKQFGSLLGYPQGVDFDQMMLYVLQSGLESRPGDAYESLFFSGFTSVDQRNANPWARFGFDPDSYRIRLASTQSMMENMTGMKVDLISSGQTSAVEQLLQRALKDGWSQTQVMDAFRTGSFANLAGAKADLSAIATEQPWLQQGQMYLQAKTQYTNIFGAAPVDTKQLASWYRFNQSASHLTQSYTTTTEKSRILTPGGGVAVR